MGEGRVRVSLFLCLSTTNPYNLHMPNLKKDQLISLAKNLRENSTNAELLMWSILRNKNIEGLRFRRQHTILGYILDFYCHEFKLAIELDGGSHAQDDKIESDNLRTKKLNSIGITVLRFWNNDVLNDIEGVVDTIILEVLKRKKE